MCIRDRLEEEQKEAALASTTSLTDQELEAKVAEIAQDLEHNERNYSDIDLIYEKKANRQMNKKEEQKVVQEEILDDQMESLFTALMEEEELRQ